MRLLPFLASVVVSAAVFSALPGGQAAGIAGAPPPKQHSATSTLRVINLLQPVPQKQALSTVLADSVPLEVWVDLKPFVDVRYGIATVDYELPSAENTSCIVKMQSQNTTVLTTSLKLEPGQAYTLTFIGFIDPTKTNDGQPNAFAVLLKDSAWPPSPGRGHVRFVHASPGVGKVSFYEGSKGCHAAGLQAVEYLCPSANATGPKNTSVPAAAATNCNPQSGTGLCPNPAGTGPAKKCSCAAPVQCLLCPCDNTTASQMCDPFDPSDQCLTTPGNICPKCDLPKCQMCQCPAAPPARLNCGVYATKWDPWSLQSPAFGVDTAPPIDLAPGV